MLIKNETIEKRFSSELLSCSICCHSRHNRHCRTSHDDEKAWNMHRTKKRSGHKIWVISYHMIHMAYKLKRPFYIETTLTGKWTIKFDIAVARFSIGTSLIMTYEAAGLSSIISTANAKQFLIFIFFSDSWPEVLGDKMKSVKLKAHQNAKLQRSIFVWSLLSYK